MKFGAKCDTECWLCVTSIGNHVVDMEIESPRSNGGIGGRFDKAEKSRFSGRATA